MTDIEAARAAMASMLITALEEAERERDLSVTREPTSAELAAKAWSKLQYDFPMVSPAELDALAKEMEAEAGGGTGPFPAEAAPAYSPTNPLVAAVIEGASRTPADAVAEDAAGSSALRRAFQRLCAVVLVRVPARLARADAPDALARADAFLSKYRVGTSTPETDERVRAWGASRVDAFPGERRSVSPGSLEDAARASGSREDDASEDHASPPSADADADASDWEPLEARGFDVVVAGDANEGDANATALLRETRDPESRPTRVHRKLRDLLERARVAYFDAEAPPKKSAVSGNGDAPNDASVSGTESSSAWALRGVGNAAAELVERAWSRAAEHDETAATMRAACGDRALALLLERWRVTGIGADGEAPRRCLRALFRGSTDDADASDSDDASGARRRRARAGAQTLGSLCAPHVLFVPRAILNAADAGRASAEEERRARALWPMAAEALAPIAASLDAALADFKALARDRADAGADGERERLETHVAACCATIAFYAALAPGNAAVGTELLRSGATRAAAATFSTFAATGKAATARAAAALAAEAARRCLLLAAAASPDSAAFALAVPGVKRTIETIETTETRNASVSKDGARAAHGALWELVSSKASEEEEKKSRPAERDAGEKACAERFAASARDDPAVALDALGLLRLVQLASRARGRDAPPLFSDKTDAPLRLVLRDAADANAAVVASAAAAAARGGAALSATRKPSSSDDESDSDVRDAPPARSRSSGAVQPSRLGADGESEKRAAAASAALRLIKEIVDGFRGGAGARKSD